MDPDTRDVPDYEPPAVDHIGDAEDREFAVIPGENGSPVFW